MKKKQFKIVSGFIKIWNSKLLLTMKLIVFVLCITVFEGFAAIAHGQNAKVNLKMENVSVKQVLSYIEDQTDFFFIYNGKLVDVERKINVVADNQYINDVLMEIFSGTNIKYEIDNRQILLSYKDVSSISSIQQQKSVSGKVTDNTEGGLPGVSVVVKGTTTGTITDSDGNYLLANVPTNATLQFSFVGMKTKEIKVTTQTSINVVLTEETIGIEEVVAIGYGNQKKKDVTGAVSTVNSNNMNQGVMSSPEQLLQGKIAGVNIVSASGEPGAAQNLTIRGPGSIRSGNTPLYVIDGVPLDNTSVSPSGNAMGGSASSGFGTSAAKNPLIFLNPSDIESIDVLKDASATAIYGTRGSNGVIMITTKKGSKGNAKVDYSYELGVSNIANKIDILTASEFKNYQHQAGLDKNIYDQNTETDWYDAILRTSYTNQHNLSLSRSTDKGGYYASLSYMDQEGIVKENNLQRYSARFNVDQLMFDDKLKININLTTSYIYNTAVPVTDNGDDVGNLMTNALTLNPTYPIYGTDGKFFNTPSGMNPMAILSLYTDFTKTYRTLGNIGASLKLLKDLELKVNVGADISTASRNTELIGHNFTYIPTKQGRLGINNNENQNFLIEDYLNYKYNRGNNTFDLLGGFSYQQISVRNYGFSINGIDGKIHSYNNPGVGTSLTIAENLPSGSAFKNELQSFFGRLNYSYASKYLLTTTLRIDGSSKFGANNRYGFFPSFSGAWRIKEEGFLADTDWLSNLKLRVGWGRTGNQEIPGKITKAEVVSSVASGTGYAINHTTVTPGYVFRRTANEDIKWETTTQTNFGIDFGLLGGRISGTVDYFNKKTTDVLLQVTVADPIVFGSTQYWTNLDMEIVNSGLELDLVYNSESGRKLKWNISANATFLNNVIKKTPFKVLTAGGLSGPGMTGATANAYLEGESIGTFYVYDFLGFNKDGFGLYRGANGQEKLSSQLNGNDRIVAGSAIPDVQYNLSGGFNFKNFDFNLAINGVYGNEVYNNTANAFFTRPKLVAGNNVDYNVVSNTTENNLNSSVVSTRYLEDGSYTRLNNATLGYNVRFKGAKQLIRNMRLYVTGQNLLLITKYSGADPEVNTDKSGGSVMSYGIDYASYPKARTFLFGVNVSF